MPYIRQDDRNKYIDALKDLPDMQSKGDLEYVVFKIMKKYMKNKEIRYATLHDCVYAVQHCADEFRRRFLDAREDSAMVQNGDID